MKPQPSANLIFQRVVPLGLALVATAAAGLTVRSNAEGGIPVGTQINVEADSGSSAGQTIWYRFRVRGPDEAAFRMVRDFSPQNSLPWVPVVTDGPFDLEVTSHNRNTNELSTTTIRIDVTPRVTGDIPAITPTNNSLVFLYSAQPCTPGGRMTVTFAALNGPPQSTPSMSCRNGKSMNVYLAGLRAETEYDAWHTVVAEDRSSIQSPSVTFTTGALNFVPTPTVPTRRFSAQTSHPILFQNRLFENSVATDPDGNVVWYASPASPYLTRPQPGGYFFRLIENYAGSKSDQILREIDLAGNLVAETNAARINDQLAALGKQPINSFHHEARRLPDGRILLLASNERLLTDVQGPGEVAVIGDAILVLDSDLQLVWAWDAFDHLDVTRKALQEETCQRPGGSGCPVFYLAAEGNDWLHGNSLSLTPDGHILYSARHQDWIVKIDYANGTGTGQVLWKLGSDGDFQIIANDPAPWFSHQHDVNVVEWNGAGHVLLFDNSNVRAASDSSAHSRGQMFALDEAAMTGRLVLNLDLGAYAFALGSAQLLDGGSLHFNVGIDPNRHSTALELDSSGNVVSRYDAQTPQYRSTRMRDMYTP